MTPIIIAFGVDPGTTTGWAAIGVPAKSIYGPYKGSIEFHQQGEVSGPETAQVMSICHIINRIMTEESSRLVVVCEDFKAKQINYLEDYLAPVRIGAMLKFAVQMNYAGSANGPEFQSPGLAMETATDDRLRAWNLYRKGQPHGRDATRHAITLIRRTKQDEQLRNRCWGIG